MATTYVEPGTAFRDRDILYNDNSLTNLAKTNANYHLLGTDANGEYYANASEHLYAGNAHASNTLLIQQFMLRSVADNYLTIKNKETGEIAVQDSLYDIVYGQENGVYPLFKSIISTQSLWGSGILCHRAFAAVPLYNTSNGEPIPSGDYDLEFHYLLKGTNTWVSTSYTLHIISDDPSIESVEVKEDSVRFNLSANELASVKLGNSFYSMSTEEIEGNFIELDKDVIENELETNYNYVSESGRLFIELSNIAYGKTGITIKFGENKDGSINFSKYIVAEHYSFGLDNDFEELESTLRFVKYDSVTISETDISVDAYVRILRSESKKPSGGSGCKGSITATSIILSALAGMLATALILSKKRKLGGKE